MNKDQSSFLIILWLFGILVLGVRHRKDLYHPVGVFGLAVWPLLLLWFGVDEMWKRDDDLRARRRR